MRRTAHAALTLIALLGTVATAQEPAPPAAEATAEPTSRPLVPPPPELSGPAFLRMRGLSGPPPSATEAPKITNYFFHIRDLITEAEGKPLPEPKQAGEAATQPRSYAFEGIEGLTSKDFMRAVREGARDARDTNFGKPQEYIDRQIEANARLVLEYYPLVATDTDAKNNVFYIMEDTHAEQPVRRMLYRMAASGRSNDSLFARFVRDTVEADRERTLKMYGIAINTPGDDPVVRQLAVENLYAARMAEFRAFVASDLNAEAFKTAQGRSPEPIDLKDPSLFTISDGNRTPLKKHLANLADMAQFFGGLLKPTSDAPQSLRDGTVAVLTKMAAEIPFEDPELVTKLLAEGTTAAAPPTPPNEEEALAF